MIPRRFFWLFDFIILSFAFLTAYVFVPNLQPFLGPGGLFRQTWLEKFEIPIIWTGQLPPLTNLLWIFLTIVPSVLIILGSLGNHGPLLNQSRIRIIGGGLLAPIVGLSLVTLALFALKRPEWSRLFIFLFILLSAAGLIFYRLVLRQYYMVRRAAGYYAKNVLLIGLPASIEWIASYFLENVPAMDYRLMGYLSVQRSQAQPIPPGDAQNGATIANLPLLGDVEELGDLLIHRPIHEVIAIHPQSNGFWVKQVIQNCDYFGILLRVVPEALLIGERKALKILYLFEPLHLPAVVLTPPHWDSEALFFKRLLDVVGSILLMVLLSPLFLLIIILTKMTTPYLPVFYRWRVVGRNGVEFTGFKFTTMVADADERKAELTPNNEMNGPVFKMGNDPRVTRLGRFLRKYSLNELPQLWSVLKGDMSLVGPRPAFRHELERYEFWHKRKLSIKPGITCLWQVRGRNQIKDFDDWVKMDLEYIDNWSLWLDLKILFRTIWVVLAGTGS